jgi:hypothetical protein
MKLSSRTGNVITVVRVGVGDAVFGIGALIPKAANPRARYCSSSASYKCVWIAHS